MDPLVTQSPFLFQEQFRNEQTCKQKEEATPHPALALPAPPPPRSWSPLAWHCGTPRAGAAPQHMCVCVCACVCTRVQGTPSPQSSPHSLVGDRGGGMDAMLLHRHLTPVQLISKLLQSVTAVTPKVPSGTSACPCARQQLGMHR